MIPTIEKLYLKDLPLSGDAQKEVASIIKNKKNVNGFKFRTLGKCCVMVGKKTDNDFDLWKIAANMQELMKARKKAPPEKFRFVFLSAA